MARAKTEKIVRTPTPTLYEIRSDLLQLDVMLQEYRSIEGEELNEEQLQAIGEILGKKEETEEAQANKIQSIITLIDHWNHWAKIRKEEADRIRGLSTADENRAKALKILLYEHLKAQGINQCRILTRNLIISPNGGVRKLIYQEGLSPLDVPDKFQTRSVDFNNDAVREYLETGGELGFAYLKPRGEHLRIS